jgi:HD-like signal output (HDOD) protein
MQGDKTTMNSVLFVDDEPNILSGIRRMLRPYRHQYRFEVAENGEVALQLMEKEHFDIIVSDMRMPGINGVELLKTVRSRYPDTIRLALSGHAEIEMELECAQAAHQFMAKPISANALVATLESAINLKTALNHEKLQRAISGGSSLPSLPSLYQEILNETASPDGTLHGVGGIISKDIGMTAKILQLVNSAFFGLSRHVASTSEAATILGIDIIKSLVLSNGVFTAFKESSHSIDLNQLTHFSQRVGILAGKLAKAEGLSRKQQDRAVMCGMLHQCGKLVMANYLNLDYKTEATRPHWQWELEKTGITHAQAGAYLLGIWGLPNPIIDAIMFYINPSQSANSSLSELTMTHIASNLVSCMDESGISNAVEEQLDFDYLNNLGIESRLDDWKQITLQTFHALDA